MKDRIVNAFRRASLKIATSCAELRGLNDFETAQKVAAAVEKKFPKDPRIIQIHAWDAMPYESGPSVSIQFAGNADDQFVDDVVDVMRKTGPYIELNTPRRGEFRGGQEIERFVPWYVKIFNP